MKNKSDVAEIITGKILDAMQKSQVAPWRKPWQSLNFRNVVSGHSYRGINVLLLHLFGNDVDYLTMKQANANGARIKGGSKAIQIVFWKPIEVETSEVLNGKVVKKKIFFLRYYSLFGLNDCEASDSAKFAALQAKRRTLPNCVENLDVAEKLIEKAAINTEFGGNVACYMPMAHAIKMPNKAQFKSTEEYYSTMFHEIGHALAKESGKQLDGNFGSEKYSAEELVAEIFANFCLSYCGIDSSKAFDNSVAYLQNWIAKLSSEPKMLVNAAAQAQKRFDLLLTKLNGEKQVDSEAETEAD
jgi:antirestriction protein ArdC